MAFIKIDSGQIFQILDAFQSRFQYLSWLFLKTNDYPPAGLNKSGDDGECGVWAALGALIETPHKQKPLTVLTSKIFLFCPWRGIDGGPLETQAI